ncbi:MAG TPA: hypothetical protein EYN33_01795 [Gammaproteobacteria bacterium]|nr:hypothetical protein [Gammaproteobacteria bacterium]
MERNLQGNRDKEGNLMTDEQYAKAVPADTMLDNIIKERGGEPKEPAEKVELTEEDMIKALYTAKAEDVRGILDVHNMTAEEALDMYAIGGEMKETNPEAHAELVEIMKLEKVMGTAEESEPKTAPQGMLKKVKL